VSQGYEVIPTAQLIRNRDGWRPREVFSPTQLSLAARCRRSWALRYLHGVKAERRTKSMVLGTLIHAALEAYMQGGTVYDIGPHSLDAGTLESFSPNELAPLFDAAPKRALSGTHLLPTLSTEPTVCETQLVLNTGPLFEAEPIQFSSMSAIDLVTQRASVWRVDDYKSTAGDRRRRDPWAYVPTVAKLKQDCQAILYALSVMQQTGAPFVECQWTYFLTNLDLPERATCVKFSFSWDEAIEAARPWLLLADELRQRVRAALYYGGPPPLESIPQPPIVFPEDDAPCKDYGGCVYHNSRRGPCDAGNSVRELLQAANVNP